MATKYRPRKGGDLAEAIAAMNRDHALVLAGDTAVVLKEMVGENGKPEIRLLSVDAFKTFAGNRKVSIEDKKVALPTIWLRHPDRRQYDGITFAPGEDAGSFFNLWRGFDVEPAPGDCSLFLDHLLANVCQGDEAHFRWVVGWFAHLVQRPSEKLGTALVLRGSQGVGKTKVGEIVGSLFSRHYALVDTPRFVTGNFNAHMAACLLLQVDEGFWLGDRAAEGRLKGLVTAPYHFIEKKRVDAFPVRNLVRLLITSNHDTVIPAGMDERRFAVLDVGEAAKQNHAYFAAMDAQMAAGGREALLHHLLAFDLSTVDLRTIPRTGALDDQVVASLPPVHAWWFECLRRGHIRPSDGHAVDIIAWPQTMGTDDVFASFLAFSDAMCVRSRSLETQLGQQLKKVVPGLYRARNGNGSGYHYKIPSLADCRDRFASVYGWTGDWDGV